ncbi:MAG: metallophosphoesterase family protein [Methanoculleaceae archaeon]
MIRTLLIADLHGNYSYIDSFLDLNPEIVIIAGDITNFGPAEVAEELLSRIDLPCFAIPGNCDPRELLDLLDESGAISLHGVSRKIGPITFTGIGGSNATPFNTPFELSEEEIAQLIDEAYSRADRNVHNVLVSHAPPEGTLDAIGDAHVGSTALREALPNFDLVCCAHIHEQRGIMEVEGVKVVNPGPASDGNCALITFGDETGEIRIELQNVSSG